MTDLSDLYTAYKQEIDAHHYRQANNIKHRPNKQHRKILRENRVKLMRRVYPRGKAVIKMMGLS
ncbi:hypothetical protein I5Q96_11290 [Serratia marcescens]|nr:hypothetical protein [Serratia marcescens]MBH3041586.1 hypothetical protein [Serratia marcescens]